MLVIKSSISSAEWGHLSLCVKKEMWWPWLPTATRMRQAFKDGRRARTQSAGQPRSCAVTNCATAQPRYSLRIFWFYAPIPHHDWSAGGNLLQFFHRLRGRLATILPVYLPQYHIRSWQRQSRLDMLPVIFPHLFFIFFLFRPQCRWKEFTRTVCGKSRSITHRLFPCSGEAIRPALRGASPWGSWLIVALV